VLTAIVARRSCADWALRERLRDRRVVKSARRDVRAVLLSDFDAAQVEHIRAQEIQTAAEALLHLRRLWVARVHEERNADLSTRGRAEDCGVD
jgi:hypothetical protein